MIHNLINFFLKFSLFYDISQSKRKMLKEFREDLQKEKSSQNPITVRTYEDLAEVDKVIINRFKDCFRNCDNAVYLSHKLGYSYDGINKRINCIAKQIYNNILRHNETVQMR